MKFQSTALKNILNILVIVLYCSSVFWIGCKIISSGGITTTIRID